MQHVITGRATTGTQLGLETSKSQTGKIDGIVGYQK
jgi:hypothetical protein